VRNGVTAGKHVALEIDGEPPGDRADDLAWGRTDYQDSAAGEPAA
jgi:hypothetical protein